MSLGRFLTSLTKPELEEIQNYCNFSPEDENIFKMLSKGKSRMEISIELKISEQSVSRRIARIKQKVVKTMVIITQNGKQVDISDIQLSEEIKNKILSVLS